MSEPTAPGSEAQRHAWERRAHANVRLALLFGGIAFALFLIALWKLRPF